MTERQAPWPSDELPEEQGTYKLYSPFYSRDEVLAAFEKKWGYTATCAHYTRGGWLVGPIREGER